MDQEPHDIREAIVRERAAVAETVSALAAKADIKGRLKDKVTKTVDHVEETVGGAAGKVRDLAPEPAVKGASTVARAARRRPLPVAAAVVLAVTLLLWRPWRLVRNGTHD